MTIIEKLQTPEIRAILQRNHVSRLYLIGSYARGDNSKKSDIDFIYSVKEGSIFTLFNIGDMKMSLEENLGLSVDLVSEKSIRKELRNTIETDKIRIF